MKKLLSILALLLLWDAGGIGSAQESAPGPAAPARKQPPGRGLPAGPGPGQVNAAQDAAAARPFVVVSFAGYDALRGQIDAVGKLAAMPGWPRAWRPLSRC